MTRSTNGHREDEASAAIQAIDDMGEVELGTVRLINNSNDGRSWDPKKGEARQHISTVLGEAFYSSQRRKHKIYECLSQHPHPICNFVAIGLGGVCLLFLILFATSGQTRSVNHSDAATYADDGDISPEGVVHSNFGLTHDYRGRTRQVHGRGGMVAADHGRCSDIGRDALQEGGTAVDAAVATALCQGVVNPQASGLGGGTIMLIKGEEGYEVIDAREVAPRLATVNMFKDNPEASVLGGLAVGVPLELKGLAVAHARHGKLSWSRLVAPAADLAREGFPAHPYLINTLTNAAIKERLMQRRELRDIFYIKGWFSWRAPKVNETCCARPRLAELLDSVAKHGPPALYQTYAKELSQEIRAAGGIITESDLMETEPIIRKAVMKIKVWGLEIYAPPPPSAAATLLTAIQILAGYETPLAFQGGLGTHRLVESLKHAFALRQQLGDPSMTCPDDALMAPPDDFAPPARQPGSAPAQPVGLANQPRRGEPLGAMPSKPALAEELGAPTDEAADFSEETAGVPGRGDEEALPGVEPLSSAEQLADEGPSEPFWAEEDPPSTPADSGIEASMGQTGELATPDFDYGLPGADEAPSAAAQASTIDDGNPFNMPGLYDAADAINAGTFGQADPATLPDSGNLDSEDQGLEQEQTDADSEEALMPEGGELGDFGRRRLLQWRNGGDGAGSNPGTGFGQATHSMPQGCLLDLRALLADLVSPEFATELRESIGDDETDKDGVKYGGKWAPPPGTGEEARDAGTTHLSVVDKNGLAVSMTSTINLAFGSMLLSPSTGLILNNEMDDFSTPGRANTYGLRPSTANFIAAGKKPLSSMSPLIVQQADGQIRAVLGGSGGPRILSAVMQTLIRLVALGEDPLTAIAAPRLHHQWLPNVVTAENWTAGAMPFRTSPMEIEELRARGHLVNGSAWSGVVQAIVVDPFTRIMTGASDPRKDGAPACVP